MSWLLYNGSNKDRRQKVIKSNPDGCSSGNIVLDLRRGIAFALTHLSCYQPQDIEHVTLRQTALPAREPRDTKDDLLCIVQAITRLPHLKTIVISDFHENPLPASCLVVLLQQSLSLSTLRFDSVCLSGRRHDFGWVAHFLQRHSSLETICFSDFRCVWEEDESDGQDYGAPSSPLLSISKALSQIAALTNVEILETSGRACGWTGEVLSELCKSKSLSTLRIRGIRFLNDDDVAWMARSIQSNIRTSLKELWILSCDVGYGGIGPAAVAQLLRNNTTLEVFGLNQLFLVEHAMAIADALTSNRTLRCLHLSLRDGFTSPLYTSLAKLMELNYTLEKISGGLVIGIEMQNQIEFYLQMNRNGRRVLLEDDNATRKQWLDALCMQGDNISAVFYLLSRNPSLCSGE